MADETLASLAAKIRAREISPVEATEACLARIESLGPSPTTGATPARRAKAAPSPAPSENGQAFLALIVEVPLHLPTNDSVPINDFFAGEKVPFAMKCSPVPPSGGM